MENFNIYNKIVAFDNYVRVYIIPNIPAIHRDFRIHILDEMYHMIRILYSAIYTKGNIRIKYLVDLLVTISLLDFLLSQIFSLCQLKNKHVIYTMNHLADIRNMVHAWKRNEEEKK